MLLITIMAMLAAVAAAARPQRRSDDGIFVDHLNCLYMTSEVDWKGEGLNLCQIPAICSNKLPDGLSRQVSSAGADGAATCFLFSEKYCQGEKSAPITNPGYANLGDIGFDYKALSWMCLDP